MSAPSLHWHSRDQGCECLAGTWKECALALRGGLAEGRVSGRCPGIAPTGIPTSTGLSALRQGADRPLGGFHGCIHEVRINNELQDFKALPPQSLGVSPGCKSCTVCRHGLCRAVEKDSVVCECHPGWTGPLCDQEAPDPCLGHRSVPPT